MGGVIVIIVVVVLIVAIVLKSFHSIGPTEVGLVTKRFAFRKLPEDNPIAFHGEAGYQADAADAGPALQAVADLRGEEVPVGAGAGRRDRRGDRAGGRAAADRRQERGRTRPSSATSPTSRAFVDGGGQKGVQRPVLPPGTLLPIHPVAFLVVTARKVYGLPVSPDVRSAQATRRRAACRSRSGSRPSSCTVDRASRRDGPQRHDRHRHDARRASRCRRATSRAASAGSTTSRRWKRRARRAGRRGHRGAARLARTTCTTTTRTSRRSSTTAARSVCSTTRCCTARTC